MKLAIQGHRTRGKEVIKILEMLGGKNKFNSWGVFKHRFYTIADSRYIIDYSEKDLRIYNYIKLTLEEFEKLYPYKVGDKVTLDNKLCTIIWMCWECDNIYYQVQETNGMFIKKVVADELKPYKEQETIDKTKFPYEIGTRVSVKGTHFDKLATIVGLSYNSCACMQYEIQFDGEDIVVHYPTNLMTPINTEQSMEEKDEKTVKHVFNANVISFDIAQKDRYELDLQGKFEVVLREGKYYVERIKPQYPKDYEGCCKVLGIRSDWHLTLELDTPATHDLSVTKEFDYVAKLESLRKLLICRDAYWKLAGEQMGLANPWEPDYSEEDYEQGCPIKYVIYYTGTHIRKERKCTPSYVLSFPTKEMLVSFYDNFKDLINDCKELL